MALGQFALNCIRKNAILHYSTKLDRRKLCLSKHGKTSLIGSPRQNQELTHNELLDAIGSEESLKCLIFDAGPKLGTLEDELRLYAFCFESLVEEYPSLETLTIYNMEFTRLGFNGLNARNESIVTLNIINCFFFGQGINRIAKADLPSLRNLKSSRCRGHSSIIDVQSNHILDSFTYGTADAQLPEEKVYIHIKDAIDDQYMVLEQETSAFKLCSKEECGEFKHSMVSSNILLRVEVTCEYLRTITFTSPNLNATCVVHELNNKNSQ